MKGIRRIWRIVLDIVFPPVCVSCRRHAGEGSPGSMICRPCFDSININSLWLPQTVNIVIAAVGSYSDRPLRELIHSLKYGKMERSAGILGKIMGEYVRRTGLMNLIDVNNAVIVPIPLHGEKIMKRGFNQSELIAKEIGKEFGIKVVNALKRVKNTPPQIEMKNDMAREENLKGAFAIDPIGYSVLAKDLILIDDVLTTGATIREAMKVLRKLKPGKIVALVAARAGY
jgi:ComF family protein